LIRTILTGLGASLVTAVIGILGWLFIAPPELLRVGDGYAAKMVCSNVFLAERDAKDVLALDVQAPGNPALKLISVRVDTQKRSVTAHFLGLFAPSGALYRDGLGCVSVPDMNWAAASAIHLPAAPVITPLDTSAWPQGNGAAPAATPELAAIFNDAKLTGPSMRGIVIIRDGHLLAETYGAGFSANTPLLGWSMSKTVNAVLLGRVVQAGKLSLDDKALFPQWTDGRKDIRIRDLTAMKSGLEFNEDYGDVSDVSRMLYEKPDMATFAVDKPLTTTTGAHFAYSTGTSFILARLWMDRLGDPAAALAYPRNALFGPLGMTSATMETDEHGTFAGGSYIYATARDWARFGQFLMQDGVWNGERLLPEGFVGLMRTSNGSKDGYSLMQTWILGPQESETGATGLPADTFWLRGHDGQTVTIIPSMKLIIVRMGLTPWEMGYRPEPLISAVIHATR
jgi:CubicO group peptidase (beta-lactamase class C family)